MVILALVVYAILCSLTVGIPVSCPCDDELPPDCPQRADLTVCLPGLVVYNGTLHDQFCSTPSCIEPLVDCYRSNCSELADFFQDVVCGRNEYGELCWTLLAQGVSTGSISCGGCMGPNTCTPECNSTIQGYIDNLGCCAPLLLNNDIIPLQHQLIPSSLLINCNANVRESCDTLMTLSPSISFTQPSLMIDLTITSTSSSMQPMPSTTGSSTSTTPMPSTTGSSTSTTPMPSTTGSSTSTTPTPSTTGSLTSTTPTPSTTGSLTSTTPTPSTTGSLTSTTPTPSTTGSLTSTTPTPSTTGSLTSTTPTPSTTGSLTSTTPMPSITAYITLMPTSTSTKLMANMTTIILFLIVLLGTLVF